MQVPKLRRWREFRALTQEELADRAGISPRSVAGYEGGAGARPGTVRALATALDVDVSALLEEPEAPKAPSSSLIAADIQVGEEQRDKLDELRDFYRETKEGVDRLSGVWEERLAKNDLDRASVEEFVNNTWAIVPALRGELTNELIQIAGALSMEQGEMVDEDDNFSPELLSLSTLEPAVDRYFTVGKRVVEVWETRFTDEAEATGSVTDLDRFRVRAHSGRRVG